MIMGRNLGAMVIRPGIGSRELGVVKGDFGEGFGDNHGLGEFDIEVEVKRLGVIIR